MNIRTMRREDETAVFEMMRAFYDSPALIHKSSDAVLRRDIADCLSDLPFVEGYIFEEEGEVIGYSMIAKSYTTEYGGLCIWIEDLNEAAVASYKKNGYEVSEYFLMTKEMDKDEEA